MYTHYATENFGISSQLFKKKFEYCIVTMVTLICKINKN